MLQVASTIVDLLQRFFPQHMDRLEREKAFFVGPGPLLLSSLVDDDLAILLSGSDRRESQASTAQSNLLTQLDTCTARLTLGAQERCLRIVSIGVWYDKGLRTSLFVFRWSLAHIR